MLTPPHDHGHPPQPASPLGYVGLALATGLLSCGLAAGALNIYATTAPMAGLPAHVCAGFALHPPQVGWSWETPVSSRISPLATSPLAVCLNVPHAWVSRNVYVHADGWLWP